MRQLKKPGAISNDVQDDRLDHLLQQFVYLVLTAAEVTTFDEVVDLLPPPASRGVQLEGPQEVGCVLEVGADREDLMDEMLHADNAKLAKSSLNQVVGGDGSAVAIDLDETALVHQLAYRLEVGRSPGDVGLFSSTIFSKWSDRE